MYHVLEYKCLDDDDNVSNSGQNGSFFGALCENNCLDVSDTSKRLSLLDILKKDELSFKNTLTPRTA